MNYYYNKRPLLLLYISLRQSFTNDLSKAISHYYPQIDPFRSKEKCLTKEIQAFQNKRDFP